MGTVDWVTFEDQLYILSIVKWGFLRRRAGRGTSLQQYGFVPRYEMAVYKASDNLRPASLNEPVLVLHFKDKIRMEEVRHMIAHAIREGGLDAMNERVFYALELSGVGIYVP